MYLPLNKDHKTPHYIILTTSDFHTPWQTIRSIIYNTVAYNIKFYQNAFIMASNNFEHLAQEQMDQQLFFALP